MADTKPTPSDNMSLISKILMGLSLHPMYPEARPFHVILWTGDLMTRFNAARRVVVITVNHDEHFEPVGSDLNFWDFNAQAISHPTATFMLGSLLKSMWNAGGIITDGSEHQLSEGNLKVLKEFHELGHVSLVVELLGTDHFNNGEDLNIAWILQDGKFYAGPVLDDMAHEVLPACEELFTTTPERED